MGKNEELIDFLTSEGHLKTPRLIEAFRRIDRADFVLPEHRSEAYENYPLLIGEEQTISQPSTVAFMLELLAPEPGDQILDVGAGSGWQTALLAAAVCAKPGLAQETDQLMRGTVVAVERIAALCELARQNLDKYGLIKDGCAEIHCLDATRDIPIGEYDGIIAGAAAAKEIPQAWRRALKIRGRIVAPVGNSVWVFQKIGRDQWVETEHKGFVFVPLVGDQKSKTKNQKPKAQIKNKKFLAIPPLTLLLFAFLFLVYETYLPHSLAAEAREVTIAKGMGSRQIGALLKREGLIRSKWAFVSYVTLKGVASSLKPGVYVFERNSISEIAAELGIGGGNERLITIPEGWTVKDIAEYMERGGIGSAEEFMALASPQGSQAFAGRFAFLSERPDRTGLEGYLFPDTYRIYRDATAEDIAMKMLENFERKVYKNFAEYRAQTSLFEIATMASLIEKEVVSDDDRALVSGILWKRLEVGIPLQVDATITYITGKTSTKISRAETRIDSPYNTYKYRGLPRGPIANPGLSAIKAAINPRPSPYLYYLSVSDGRTIFSKTLEEHNAAKAAHLQ